MPAAVVTGSSRGLGRAIALRFASDGYDVAVNYHSSDEAAAEVADAVRERGQGAVVVGADVSEPDGASRLVETAADEFGGVDHVVNNAGIDQHVYTESLSPADFDRIMDVNVNSAFNVTKAALSYLEASDDDPSVTNVSSILAHTGAPIECHYAASKGALISLGLRARDQGERHRARPHRDGHDRRPHARGESGGDGGHSGRSLRPASGHRGGRRVPA